MSWTPLNRRFSPPSAPRKRQRRAWLEALEPRTVMASLPYGAMADDTGEFMLGKVHVTVVALESNSSISGADNGTVTIGGNPVAYTPNDWTPEFLSDTRARIASGLQWWADSLDSMPNVADGLLSFDIDWSHFDNPVQTGYEPIARISNDYSLWAYDFLSDVGFDQTLNMSSDIRAFNNYARLQSGSDWAFTMFVVNDANDLDKSFAAGGAHSQAFAFAGGQFLVSPASRPASTFSHETGHMFWALDEYSTSGNNYNTHRGYYNTANSNSVTNPSPGFTQADSIMASGVALGNAFANHTTSQASAEMIGWKDSDGDGIFDVLDVPFTLEGFGKYDPSTSLYSFTGSSSVKTLPNQNPSGLHNDITINRIRRAEFSIDGEAWQTAAAYDAYTTNLALNFFVPAGNHEVRIRTFDSKTGVASNEFIGHTTAPSIATPSGAGGYLYRDDNANGSYDAGEVPLVDWELELVDAMGNFVRFQTNFEPDALGAQQVNTAVAGVTLSAIGSDVVSGQVVSGTSTTVPNADLVLKNNSVTLGQAVDTWTSDTRKLKINFDSSATVVNVNVLGALSRSYGRLEIYDANNKLLGRTTSRELGVGNSEMLSLARPQGDIAYAIVSAHAKTQIVIDSFSFGPKSIATTDANGRYVLPDLPAGDYHVEVITKPNFVATSSNGNRASFAISSGASETGVNFAFRSLGSNWQNTATPNDVNHDGVVTALDALIVINWLNSSQSTTLPFDYSPSSGYVDVNADTYVTALDALIVINQLNSPSSSFAASSASIVTTSADNSSSAAPATFAAASAPVATQTAPSANPYSYAAGTLQSSGESPEGEAAPATAEEYYALNPLHILNLPDDKPCTCSECVGTAIDLIVAGDDSSDSIFGDTSTDDAAAIDADLSAWLPPVVRNA